MRPASEHDAPLGHARIDRRRLIAGGAALAVSALTRRSRAERRPTNTCPHFVVIQLSGGIDAVYTTDPKERRDVDTGIDIPYERDAIRIIDGLRVGPHLAPFAPVAKRLAIVNGVRVSTANHVTGNVQFERMKIGSLEACPTLLELLGERRDESIALSHVGGAWLDGSMDELYEATSEDDFGRMSRALKSHLPSKTPSSARERGTAKSYADAAGFFARLGATPKMRHENWLEAAPSAEGPSGMSKPDAQEVARVLRRALWFLEHDLAAGIRITLGDDDQAWDTHNHNAARQSSASGIVMPLLARFIAELDRRPCRHGTLSRSTTVIIGSEIGRFPKINTNLGKDHLPEIPMIVAGPAVSTAGRGAQFGATGKSMQALPLDLTNGRERAGGHLVDLDDIGTTLLHWGGIPNPRVFGYRGRVLDFLTGG